MTVKSLRRAVPGLPPGDLRWVAGVAAVALAVVLAFGVVPRFTSADPHGAPTGDGAAPSSAVGPAPPSGGSAVVVRRPVDRPLHVAFIGDSLTVGQSARAEDQTFRRLIVKAWGGDDRVRADEYAHAGDTTKQVDQLVPADEQVDIAVVETGTNDFWKRAAPDQVGRDYDALLGKLRASSPNVALVCLGVWQDPPDALAYDLPIKDQCTAHGGRFLPLAGIFDLDGVRGPANVPLALKDGGLSDDFHPNDAGHLKIADLVTNAVAVSAPPVGGP